MQRIVSVIERSKNGGLAVTGNREQIKCDADTQSGIDKILAAAQKRGAELVLILAEDDSVLRHWTKPAEAEDPQADPPAAA